MPDPANGVLDFGANQQFSVSVWIKGSDTSQSQHVFNKRNKFVAGYELAYYPPNLVFRIDEGTNRDTALTGSAVLDNQWHHVVVGRNATQHFLYVDGVLRSTTNDSTLADLSNANPFFISQEINKTTSAWNGSIDDVRVYNKALSGGEVNDLFVAGGGTPPPPPPAEPPPELAATVVKLTCELFILLLSNNK